MTHTLEVAPHGLIGQTFDGDDIAIDGAVDDYSGKIVTTTVRLRTHDTWPQGSSHWAPCPHPMLHARGRPYTIGHTFDTVLLREGKKARVLHT